MGWYIMRHRIAAACAAAFTLVTLNAAAQTAPVLGPDSNLPVPRFVSLKTEGANGRRGPGLEHRVEWIYARAGLPLQVTAESGPWRRVRDPDGAQSWMHAQNLEPRRTAYVRETATLRRQPREGSPAAAQLAPGVIGTLTGCEGEWRRIAIAGRVGWVQAASVWGADDCANI